MTTQKGRGYFFFEDKTIKGTFSSVFTHKNLSSFDKEDLEKAIHVIDKSVHTKAVEALKEISKHKSAYSGENSVEANIAIRTLRELGEGL